MPDPAAPAVSAGLDDLFAPAAAAAGARRQRLIVSPRAHDPNDINEYHQVFRPPTNPNSPFFLFSFFFFSFSVFFFFSFG